MGEQDHYCACFRVLAGVLSSSDMVRIDALGIPHSALLIPASLTFLTFKQIMRSPWINTHVDAFVSTGPHIYLASPMTASHNKLAG